MLDNPPYVSVIIPVYNDPQRLKTCLQALEMQTYPKDSYEVIVVDNGSDQSIEPMVSRFPQAKSAYEAQPGSYAARNKGVAIAQGEILAFTDSDCIPMPDWLEKGVATLMRVPNCGIVGGKLVPLYQKPSNPTAVELYEVIMYYGQQRFVDIMHFSVTANLLTFKSVFQQVGTFDSDLKSSGDYEWGQRVFEAGYQQVYDDESRVDHPVRSTLSQLHRKTVRLAGGYEERLRHGKILSLENGKNYVPPVLTLLNLDRELCVDLRVKLEVIWIWARMKWIEIQTRLCLKFGWETSAR